MRAFKTTRQFERDLKRARKRRKDLDKLWVIVESLRKGEALAARHRPHKLSGSWSNSWECHIEPDWLLVWHDEPEALVFVRTGSHSDLFG